MLPVHYTDNAIPSDIYDGAISEIRSLNWCRPPSGIPGNRTPRNVAVLGDGSNIVKTDSGIDHVFGHIPSSTFAYPLFQTSKNCSAIYEPNPIPDNISHFIIHLRSMVRKLYGDTVIDVDNMFNVVVCNYYTEHCHQINAHRDDERWLSHNQLDSNGKPCASIIASLTIYPDDPNPPHLRTFEIQNDDTGEWQSHDLRHNSVLFFSNHNHRAKALSKRKSNVRRYNLTFRTVAPGLLGNVGYSNFYRYMSIPTKIVLIDGDKDRGKEQYYIDAAHDANRFNERDIFDTDITVDTINRVEYDIERTNHSSKLSQLPRYVKPLCSNYILNAY